MTQIKNIIFDLGGVLLDIDFRLSNKAFEASGIGNFSQYFSRNHVNILFEKLEIGTVSNEEFYEEFRALTNSPLPDNHIKDAWNAMLLHFSKDRMDFLESLKSKYNIYLFSNTNKIHVEFFTELCREEIGKPLESFFVKTWYSNELHFRKPYPASFTEILQMEKLIASETLFIDDTAENIEGARLSGLQTIHLVAPMSVLELGL